ncbi:MAG: prepilin-type N-terminal cleavage/methylation domain-containing protein [Pyrinomonadaceae bacterium]
MAKNIVTGKASEQKAVSSKQFVSRSGLLTAHCSRLTGRGFTLLELMIVISIIIILAAVALPQYHKTIMHARETVLRDDLFRMRSLIDQYAADKGKLPQSLDDLVSAGYMREIPTDPITDQKDWVPVPGEDVYSSEGGSGIIDIRSASQEVSTEGTPYGQW